MKAFREELKGRLFAALRKPIRVLIFACLLLALALCPLIVYVMPLSIESDGPWLFYLRPIQMILALGVSYALYLFALAFWSRRSALPRARALVRLLPEIATMDPEFDRIPLERQQEEARLSREFDRNPGPRSAMMLFSEAMLFPLRTGAKRIAYNFAENLEWDRESRTFRRAFTRRFIRREFRETRLLVVALMIGYTFLWIQLARLFAY